MGKICEHYDLDCKQEERSCKGCAFNNKNKIEEIEPLKEVVKLQHEAIKILIER